jgi:hypothetical protein
LTCASGDDCPCALAGSNRFLDDIPTSRSAATFCFSHFQFSPVV